MPIAPPPCRWALPDPRAADEHGIVAVGADLEPGTLLEAYRRGLFCMPLDGHLVWWSPDPRGVLRPPELHVSRSLRRSLKLFEIRRDTAFLPVVERCADPRREGAWMTPALVRAYVRLHELGWAHSVEAWTPDRRLAGGVFGVRVGNLFAAESMFHTETDASKVALHALASGLPSDALIDVQWSTPHLETLGVVDLARAEYLGALPRLVGPTHPTTRRG